MVTIIAQICQVATQVKLRHTFTIKRGQLNSLTFKVKCLKYLSTIDEELTDEEDEPQPLFEPGALSMSICLFLMGGFQLHCVCVECAERHLTEVTRMFKRAQRNYKQLGGTIEDVVTLNEQHDLEKYVQLATMTIMYIHFVQCLTIRTFLT